MIYLYIGKNSIKLLSLAKTLLGQYNISYFEKTHEVELLDDGQVKSVDMLASAIKEALTMAKPQAVTETQVYLILPQESFQFAHYDIPTDIADNAIEPFIRDKARADFKFDIETAMYDFVETKQEGKAKVFLYAQEKKHYDDFAQIFSLLGLNVTAVLPETLGLYKLFEKTIRADKYETFLYVYYDSKQSYGYLYDSFGLLQPKRLTFTGDIETSLKTKIEKIEKESIKINRIILSGRLSEKVRQDLFTKKVGVWTNPLKKIILNFYQEYLKLIILSPNDQLPLLDLDACLGGFIFSKESNAFSFNQKSSPMQKNKFQSGSKPHVPFSIGKRDVVIFIASFILSFGAIFLYPRISGLVNKTTSMVKPKPTAAPIVIKPTTTPMPVVDKKTIRIKILNGSGTKGLANEIKAELQKKDYVEILTGNADAFDVETTTVQVKDGKKDALQAVLTDLKDHVTVSKESITTLLKDESADIILTIGKDYQ